jgi:hypothetical protein
MTKNSAATSKYLHALHHMPNTKPGNIAKMADRMAGSAFCSRNYAGLTPPSEDAMMAIETAFFVALCDANGIDWRHIG